MTADPSADPSAHPFELPPAAGRLTAVRVVSAGLILGLGFWAFVVGLVVWFALDNEPIAGNAVRVAGLSVVTWAGLAVALTGPVGGLVVANAVAAAGLAKLAAEPEAEPSAEADKFATVFATATFVEFAVAEGSGVTAALLYHLTADTVLLAALGVVAALLLARFPSGGRSRRWYDAAADGVARVRAEKTG